MTEVDLSQFFGQAPRLTDEQERAIAALHQRQHDEEILAFARVQFFAPMLCACDRRYDWSDPTPPQLGCVIHGHMQTDHDGRILMFRRPPEPHKER